MSLPFQFFPALLSGHQSSPPESTGTVPAFVLLNTKPWKCQVQILAYLDHRSFQHQFSHWQWRQSHWHWRMQGQEFCTVDKGVWARKPPRRQHWKREVRSQSPQRMEHRPTRLETSQLAMSAYSFPSQLRGALFLGDVLDTSPLRMLVLEAICLSGAITPLAHPDNTIHLLPMPQICKALLRKDWEHFDIPMCKCRSVSTDN